MPQPFIDFPAIREAISIEKAAAFVGLPETPKDQIRCACPVCQTTDTRALVVTKSAGKYYCFADKRGGDAIGLVAHIKGIGQRDAALLLQQTFLKKEEKPKAARVKRAKLPKPSKNEITTLKPVHEELDQWEAFIARL
jgi:hypothetical protein